ncbi:MAG: hypothetical protein VKK32_03915 [Candidatus Melainabacteria bacterium]|nr:hypothetical protein [Candidatus Melainabacteria bacterium]
MSSEFITARNSLFGWVTNNLSTGFLADGRTVSTYRSNLQAFLYFLDQAIVTPVATNWRSIGSNLAAA